jgi:hypothetical protein
MLQDLESPGEIHVSLGEMEVSEQLAIHNQANETAAEGGSGEPVSEVAEVVRETTATQEGDAAQEITVVQETAA